MLLLNGRDCTLDPDVPNSRYIALEQWSVTLDRASMVDRDDRAALYKRLIVLIRSLYTYVSMLPAYRTYRRCRQNKLGAVRMVCRFTADPLNPLDLGHCMCPPTYLPLPACLLAHPLGAVPGKNTSEFAFGDVQTPEGILTVRVQYRTRVHFDINEHERVY